MLTNTLFGGVALFFQSFIYSSFVFRSSYFLPSKMKTPSSLIPKVLSVSVLACEFVIFLSTFLLFCKTGLSPTEHESLYPMITDKS